MPAINTSPAHLVPVRQNSPSMASPNNIELGKLPPPSSVRSPSVSDALAQLKNHIPTSPAPTRAAHYSADNRPASDASPEEKAAKWEATRAKDNAELAARSEYVKMRLGDMERANQKAANIYEAEIQEARASKKNSLPVLCRKFTDAFRTMKNT